MCVYVCGGGGGGGGQKKNELTKVFPPKGEGGRSTPLFTMFTQHRIV